MAIDYPQFELPRGLSGGADLWDDDGAAAQILLADYFTQAPPEQNLSQSSRFDNANSFFAHALTSQVTLTQSALYDNAQAFYSHTVSSTSTYYVTWAELEVPAAAASSPQTLTQSATFGNTNSFYAHSLSSSIFLAQGATYANSNAFFVHSLAAGSAV